MEPQEGSRMQVNKNWEQKHRDFSKSVTMDTPDTLAGEYMMFVYKINIQN